MNRWLFQLVVWAAPRLQLQVIPARPPTLAELTREQRWRLALKVFSLWYDRYGLSWHAMVKAGLVAEGMMSQRAYQKCSAWLEQAGVILKETGRGAHYVGSWSRERLVRYLNYGIFEYHPRYRTPYPTGNPPGVLLSRSDVQTVNR